MGNGSLREAESVSRSPDRDLELRCVRLGFIPLTDCAVLVAAREQGFFARHGLDVRLCREPSWANIRDKVDSGALDGAHMLAPMALAAGQGVPGAGIRPITTAFSLGLNGNAITVSRGLYQRLQEADPVAMATRPITARALKTVIAADQRAGRPPLTFATVFSFSAHDLQLRYWLAAAGIDPDRDVRLVVIPPPRVADHLEAGLIDGYCVGEPWNSLAVEEGTGCCVATSSDLAPLHPEKVLLLRPAFAQRHPDAAARLVAALIESCRFCDVPRNWTLIREVLTHLHYLNAPMSSLLNETGVPFNIAHPTIRSHHQFTIFHRYRANAPTAERAHWLLAQLVHHRLVPAPSETVRERLLAGFDPGLFSRALVLVAEQARLNALEAHQTATLT
ncbi:MAG TPA: hypothetical protein DCY13_16820 [Verrucomicrobiales bacterium]|nr:hypothetical protein [Verrucomicrobiales bacterium]